MAKLTETGRARAHVCTGGARRRARSRLPWVALALLANLRCASAFESDEHRAAANAAFQVALAMAGAAPKESGAGEAIAAMAQVDGRYGDITACVDYFLYPEKMLAFQWNRETTIANEAEVPARASYPLEALAKVCSRETSRLMQASHSNHAHFQQDLLVSLRVWHAMAISLARDEDNWYGALMVNAIADHYLQDFFAPGHVVTPRDIMTDVPATAMHDAANDRGAMFVADVGDDGLRRVLRFMCRRTAAGDAEPLGHCPDTAALVPRAYGTPDEVADAIRSLLADAPAPIRFLGDTHLFEHAQLRQRVLLLAVETQSILDVVGGRGNHLKAMRFAYDPKTSLPSARIDFGAYAIGPAVVSAQAAAPAPATVAAGEPEPVYAPGTTVPTLFVSDVRLSQSSGYFKPRDIYSIGWTGGAWHMTPPGASRHWLDAVEVDLSLGLSHYKQGELHGNGGFANLAFTLPETEGSLGPYVSYMSYTDQGRKVWRPAGGLRFEGGFSSYFTFFLLGGIDQSTDAQGRLVRGRAWGGGLRMSFPTSRILRAVDGLLPSSKEAGREAAAAGPVAAGQAAGAPVPP